MDISHHCFNNESISYSQHKECICGNMYLQINETKGTHTHQHRCQASFIAPLTERRTSQSCISIGLSVFRVLNVTWPECRFHATYKPSCGTNSEASCHDCMEIMWSQPRHYDPESYRASVRSMLCFVTARAAERKKTEERWSENEVKGGFKHLVETFWHFQTIPLGLRATMQHLWTALEGFLCSLSLWLTH